MTTTTPRDTVTVGRYLATRLQQLGSEHLFGLPGDFNLTLLDEMLATPGVTWVGSSNELNASYAADGYARVGRRVGALVTTYGVGELSAMNGIAGSFAEDVPVVHIVGMPSREAMANRTPLHHTFLDGDFGHFERAFREVTIAQAVLGADAASAIDRVLLAAITHSKPVYLGVPLDVATLEVSASPLETPLALPTSDAGAVIAFEDALRRRLEKATQVTVLAGQRVHRRGLEKSIADLAGLNGVQVASQSGSKALVDERHPGSLGTYMGATTANPETREAVDSADPLILVGTVQSDFTTGFFTHGYAPQDSVEVGVHQARVGRAVFPDVVMRDAVASLHRVVAELGLAKNPSDVGPRVPEAPSADVAHETLTQEHLWRELEAWLAPATTLLAEAGTSFYGALELQLADDSDFLGQPVWSSIGYTVPAMLGAGLARPDRRPVLLVGDGSAQLTAQEFGRVFEQIAGPVVFVLNNDGYTVERAIQSPAAVYQDIVRWNWTELPSALGAAEVVTRTVRTVADLREILPEITAHRDQAFFVEVVLPPMDAPRLLVELARGIGEVNAAKGRA